MKNKEWLESEIVKCLMRFNGNPFLSEYERGYISGLSIAQSLAHELDEPQTASNGVLQNFIQANAKMRERIEDLENSKKVAIPQFVANDIYLCQIQKGTLVDAMYSAKGKVKKWIDLNGSEMYARAWLDGYEIEKEKLYEIIMPHSQEVLAHWVEEDEWEIMYREAISGNSEWKFQFTEQEIKAIDERYLAFKVPVEQ